jgi:hypothetical protein
MIENLLTGIIAYYIIIAISFVIYKLIKKEKMERTSFIKILFWAIGISILSLLPSLSSCQTTSQKKSYTLSQEDAETVKSILKFSMGSMDTVSNEMHSEFWKIVNKCGGNPENMDEIGSKEKLIEFINNTGTFYQRAFYQDALISYRTGKPFESEERKKLDENIGQDRIEKNALLMEKIANKTAVPYNGTEVIIDEEIITGVLENLDVAMSIFKHNIDILYGKTYHK